MIAAGSCINIASEPNLHAETQGTAMHGSLTPRKDFNHSILIGMRYAFGMAPAAAPAPTPVADGGAKTFLVFFDWDKYNLTSRAAGIVR